GLVAAGAAAGDQLAQDRDGGVGVALAHRDLGAAGADLVGDRERVDLAGGGLGGVERRGGLAEPALAGEAQRAARVDHRTELDRGDAAGAAGPERTLRAGERAARRRDATG